MADEEHLSLIRQGVEVWNQWREDNPITYPQLSGANLREANLREAKLHGANLNLANLIWANLPWADLRWADLSGAKLNQADLSGANLSEADLHRADLSGADLIEADLSGASLREANLSGADLSGANLGGVNLTWTILSGANLSGANLSEAYLLASIFADVDLSQVKGLELINHEGPSTIGIDTIYLSGGNIPEAFLRGAGVPDQFIAYVKSLVGKAIEYYSAFISYSHQDEEFTRRLFADLQNNNVRAWYAPEKLKIGDKFRQRIDESIRLHDKLLLVLSQDSVTSDWVEFEVEAALAKETEHGGDVLFPVRVDDAIMQSEKGWAAHIKRTRHIGDFSRWKEHDAYKVALQRLLRDLKAAGDDGESAS